MGGWAKLVKGSGRYRVPVMESKSYRDKRHSIRGEKHYFFCYYLDISKYEACDITFFFRFGYYLLTSYHEDEDLDILSLPLLPNPVINTSQLFILLIETDCNFD